MWKRHLDDLRRDVKMNTELEANVLMNSTNNTRREIMGLERRIQEDIEQMRHESVRFILSLTNTDSRRVAMDINNRKSENRIDSKRFEIEIEETHNKFTISCSDVKTQIEKMRWDSSRRALGQSSARYRQISADPYRRLHDPGGFGGLPAGGLHLLRLRLHEQGRTSGTTCPGISTSRPSHARRSGGA